MERKDEDGARRDESKEENRCGQGQTQIKHERDMNDGDDRDRPQMADDDAIDSQALTGGVLLLLAAEWRAGRRIQTLTGEATRPLDDRCQPESS